MQKYRLPLKVLLVFDGRPGHEKQSRAVAQAMAALTALELYTVKVRLPGILPVASDALRFMFRKTGREVAGWPEADLVLGTGSGTHLPMLLYRQARSQAKVVTCMLPDPLLRRYFDLCLVPRHDSPPARSNILQTTGPPCLVPGNRSQREDRGLILVGGVDQKSHFWQTDTVVGQITAIVSRLKNVTWTIASSPRTPADTLSRLAVLAEGSETVSFFPAQKTYAGWIEEQYAASSLVWVTADSVSMLYEALSAGCRVGVLPVKWKKPTNKFQRGLDELTSAGLVVSFGDWLGGSRDMPTPANIDEAGRCAKEILKRWWPARLP